MAAVDLDTPCGQSARKTRTVIVQEFEGEAGSASPLLGPGERTRSICESIKLFHIFKVLSPYQMPTSFASNYHVLPGFLEERQPERRIVRFWLRPSEPDILQPANTPTRNVQTHAMLVPRPLRSGSRED
jgi:hypothetical protein